MIWMKERAHSPAGNRIRDRPARSQVGNWMFRSSSEQVGWSLPGCVRQEGLLSGRNSDLTKELTRLRFPVSSALKEARL